MNSSDIIYVCSSNKSRSGSSRIIALLSPDLNIKRIEFDEIEKYFNDNNFRIILHNIGNAKPEVQQRAVVFGMQSMMNYLIGNSETAKKFRKYPPLQIWMNSETAAKKLISEGFNARAMYRPNQVTIPGQYIPMPKQQQVLWYWNEDDPDLNRHEKLIIDTVKQLPDIQFLFFPSYNVPIKLPNTRAIGRIAIPKYYKKVRGMVRITNRYDMGRAMFDIAAGGRWVLTYKLKEPFTHAITKLGMLPDAIRFCLDNYNDAEGMRLWNYARENFAEDVLRQRWIDEVRNVFGNVGLFQ